MDLGGVLWREVLGVGGWGWQSREWRANSRVPERHKVDADSKLQTSSVSPTPSVKPIRPKEFCWWLFEWEPRKRLSLIFTCVPSFNKSFLNIYYEAGFILGAGDSRVNLEVEDSYCLNPCLQVGRETINKWTKVSKIMSESTQSCQDSHSGIGYRVTRAGKNVHIPVQSGKRKPLQDTEARELGTEHLL